MYHNKVKVSRILFIVLIVNVLCLSFLRAQQKIDSLKTLLPNASETDKFKIYYELFKISLAKNLDQSLNYSDEAFKQGTLIKDTLAIVKACNARGYVKMELGFIREAIMDFELGLGLARQKKYTDQVKFILNNLGRSNQRLANYDKALENHLESLKIREDEKDTSAICVALNNIGVVYRDMGDIENAFSYYRQTYELKLKGHINDDIELSLVNMADASNALGKYDEAKKYILGVLQRCSNGCDKRILGLAHHALGYALLKTNELERAESEFLQALKLWQEIDDSDEINELNSLAATKFEQNDLRKALEYLDRSQELAEESEVPKYQLRNYKLYSDIYRKLKDYKLAVDYQTLYIDLNEDIFNADMIRNISRIHSRYQEKENMETIERQGNEILLSKERLRAQRNLVIFFSVVSILIMGLVFVLWRFSKVQQRANIALTAAKVTIEEKNLELQKVNVSLDEKNQQLQEINRTLDQRILSKTKELVTTNISLQKSNEELDNFIYKTSHDIRGPLASLKGIASLALIEAKDSEISKYIKMLDETAEGLIKILTRLISISQITHANLQPVPIDFEPLISDVITIQNKRGIPGKLKMEYKIEPNILLVSDRILLSMVLENLIDNAIKFQNTSDRIESFVRIDVNNHKYGIEIKVIDNGIGIDQLSAEKIFQMFVRASERSETGGLGLYLSRLAVDKLGGNISLNITEEKWTEFKVVIPPDLRSIIEQRRQGEIQMEIEKMLIANKNQVAAKQI